MGTTSTFVQLAVQQLPAERFIVIPQPAQTRSPLRAFSCRGVQTDTQEADGSWLLSAIYLLAYGSIAGPSLRPLTVRKRKHIVLAEGIREGQREPVIVIFSVHSVFLHVGECVVHPAHIPFVHEAHTIANPC